MFNRNVLSGLDLPDDYLQRVKTGEGTLNYFESIGALLSEHIYGKDILDWEAEIIAYRLGC